MTRSTNPCLSSHHTPLERTVLRGWGVPAPWLFGIGFRATFGDLDAQQHVSNTVYLRWIEAFRVHYLREHGWPEYAAPATTPMVVRRCEIDYLKPVFLDDDVVVTGRTESVRVSSCVMKYAIWRHGLVAQAKAVLVFLDKNNQKTPIPKELRANMLEIDKANSTR